MNAIDVDSICTDELSARNFLLIYTVLQDPRIVLTPQFICDYTRDGLHLFQGRRGCTQMRPLPPSDRH